MTRRRQDRTFRGDIKHPLGGDQGSGIIGSHMTEEGANRGKPRVSGAWSISSILFHVLQEPEHDIAIEVLHLETTRFSFCLARSVEHQEPQRVPIGGYGQRAYVALFDEPPSKK